MWLICGLGNPGSKYERTPHNLGFDVVDVLARRHGLEWEDAKKFKARLAVANFQGEKVVLMKPMTFMNVSGEAVRPFCDYYDVAPDRVVAVCDDIALPYGKIRLRAKGSHGSHNGLRSLIQHLKTQDFPRLRIGCQPPRPVNSMADYVLSPMWGEGKELGPLSVEVSADCLEEILASGLDKAMAIFNAWSPEPKG
ncbi:MAG: aminoacyl-tRNA hydrolase [Sumerlaeia bacterium]